MKKEMIVIFAISWGIIALALAIACWVLNIEFNLTKATAVWLFISVVGLMMNRNRKE